MTPKVKKILALVLAVGVAAVWIPQLLSANARVATRVLLEVPAEGPQTSAATAVQPSQPASSGNKSATPGVNTHGTDGDLSSSLESSIAKAKLLLPDKTGLDLDKLAMAWNVPNEITPPAPAASLTVAQPESASGLPSQVDLLPPVDPIQAFLASHPLQGTLIGTAERLANLGPIVARVGDEPVKGLVVTAIEARFVTFEHAGETLRSELIPFQARVVAKSNSSGSSPGGNATTAPNSSGTVDPTLGSLMPLLQTAVQATADASKANAAVAAPNVTSTKSSAANNTGTTSTTKEPHGS